MWFHLLRKLIMKSNAVCALALFVAVLTDLTGCVWVSDQNASHEIPFNRSLTDGF